RVWWEGGRSYSSVLGCWNLVLGSGSWFGVLGSSMVQGTLFRDPGSWTRFPEPRTAFPEPAQNRESRTRNPNQEPDSENQELRVQLERRQIRRQPLRQDRELVR